MADTVERRNAALADTERRYRLLFDSNPLPMWAWDADTKAMLAVNEAAIEHYGYSIATEFAAAVDHDLLDPSEIRASRVAPALHRRIAPGRRHVEASHGEGRA